jgi:integrase
MYARNRKKSKTGSAQIRSSNNRLQIVFTFGGQRYFVSTGLGDTPYNRKQAQDKALEVERDIAYGQFDPDNLDKYKISAVLTTVDPVSTIPISIPDLPELWQRYSEAKASGKSPATVRMYGWVANHLARCPYKLPTEAQAVFDWLSAHVPANSAQRVLMHLSACCKWARKSGLLNSNPFEGSAAEVKVKKSGTEEDEIYPFTREERDRIIAAFKANRYYNRYAPLVEFLFFTGCRPSEAVALSWKHINHTAITFEQAVIYNGKGLVLKNGLKTQQTRKFPINAQLTELLQAIKPEPYNPESLVFPSPDGKFVDWHNFTNRAWKSVLNSLPDVDYRNPYQTRHTFSSLCREANIPSIQLAKWVGNSAQMIDRVYAKSVDQIAVPEL